MTIRVLNGGKPITSNAHDYRPAPTLLRQSTGINNSSSFEHRTLRSGAIHYAAKAIGETCSLNDSDDRIDSVISAFIRADRSGRGIVDQAARERCNELSAEMSDGPSAA